jgi:hypothetical protein
VPPGGFVLIAMPLQPEIINSFGVSTRYYEILFGVVALHQLVLMPCLAYELFATWRYMRHRSTSEGGKVMNIFTNHAYVMTFALPFSFMMPLPTALALIVAHGGTTSTSGAYLGMFLFGLPMIFASRYIEAVAQWDYCTSVRVVNALRTLSYCLICFISLIGPFSGSLWCLMLAAQFNGEAHGLMLVKFRELVNAAFDKNRLEQVVFRTFIAAILGLSLGTIVGSASVPILRTSFDILGLGLQELNPAAYSNITLLAIHLFGLMPFTLATLPASLHKAGVDTIDPSAEIYRMAPDRVRKLNIVFAFICVIFKDTVTAGLETFDVLLLEVEYGYSAESSGFFAGLAMLVAAGPMILFSSFECLLPAHLRACVRYLSFLIFVSCSFAAYPKICPFSDNFECVVFMWVFRVINYIFWSICMAFVESTLFKWAMNDNNHWASFRNLSFCQAVIIEGITKCVGPFLVRSCYEFGGRLEVCILITACETLVLCVMVFGLIMPYRVYWK